MPGGGGGRHSAYASDMDSYFYDRERYGSVNLARFNDPPLNPRSSTHSHDYPERRRNLKAGSLRLRKKTLDIFWIRYYHVSLVEKQCSPCKDLARSLHLIRSLRDLASKCIPCKNLARNVILVGSFEEISSSQDPAKKLIPYKILARSTRGILCSQRS